MYANLKQIYEDYPNNYDTICELYYKLIGEKEVERKKAELVLMEYGLL